MTTVWDQQADTLDDAWAAVWAEDAGRQQVGIDHCLSMLGPVLDTVGPGSQVLDLGAGIGRLALPVAAATGATVWALDSSERMLEHLTARAAHWARTQPCAVLPVLGDGATIPPGVPVLDGVYSVVTLQHLDPDQQGRYVAEVAGRLHPGGILRFQVVTDTEAGPLSHPVDEAHVERWCTAANLDLVDWSPDPRFPTWRWATAVRP